MQILHHPFLFGIIFLCAIVTAVSAAEVVVESDQLIVKGFEDSIGLGAFSVVLGYDPAKTTVTECTFIEPFAGATNIQPDEKTVRISGFTVQSQVMRDIPVARIVYEGEGLFDVYVNTLVNARGDTIATTNPAYNRDTPASPGTQPTAGPTTLPTGSAQTSIATQIPTTTQQQSPLPGTSSAPADVGTPASVQQQTGAPETPGSVEPVVAEAGSSGTPVQTHAAKSPLSPAIGIFAFAIVLFALKRNYLRSKCE